MKIIGSAAGGGFPQWNCNFRLSRAARAGETGFHPRTQSSLAVSADGLRWALFDASPDIGQQIAATPELQPLAGAPVRSSPLSAVVLTNADVDHVAGLLSLRERQPFALYATPKILEILADNPIFNVLDPTIVRRRELGPGEPIEIADAEGRGAGVGIEPFLVAGKGPLYLEDASSSDAGRHDEGETIGIRILSPEGGKSFFYIPACAAITDELRRRLEGAAGVLFDGTFYLDDEMIAARVGEKTAARMGHSALSGPQGTLARLKDVAIGRRILVHINNTNPILDENSPERRAVEAAGWEVAEDGMEAAF
jgi:pyrroloquinoline quinone biosynthesis protein B